ncbi:MAG: hypothetical protein NTV24_00165 [Candidatus Woesebacteria bacterium]|nr:hypothetical protein [Candidatus Woesebacteria bacterium]
MTKPDVKKLRKQVVNFGMLSDAIDTILVGVQKMFDELRAEIKKGFENTDNKINFIHSDLHHQITDLKYDTPSLKDFESIKKRVDLFHPVS